MIAKILYWFTGFLPVRYINDGQRRYLERYYLFTLLGWQFYIHRFVGSDPDRGLHDHPWPRAFSIILSGWYFEQTRSGTRKVTRFNHLTGDTFHRVVLPLCPPESDQACQECWTLFFHRAVRAKEWGFLRPLKLDSNAQVFVPYDYRHEGSQTEWWKTAKSRRGGNHG